MILRALLSLVVGVAQGQNTYIAHIKQKSMQCQWWDGVSGEGGDGVSGCKGREPQNLSSVFIPPWTVQVMECSSISEAQIGITWWERGFNLSKSAQKRGR